MFIVFRMLGTTDPRWGHIILATAVVSTHNEKPATAPNGAEWNILGTAPSSSDSMAGVDTYYKVVEAPDPV
jgi:hypothetical protein